jgi:hypothetical protein
MTTARDYVPEKRHANARELQGLSQSELARRTGIEQSAISALESFIFLLAREPRIAAKLRQTVGGAPAVRVQKLVALLWRRRRPAVTRPACEHQNPNTNTTLPTNYTRRDAMAPVNGASVVLLSASQAGVDRAFCSLGASSTEQARRRGRAHVGRLRQPGGPLKKIRPWSSAIGPLAPKSRRHALARVSVLWRAGARSGV